MEITAYGHKHILGTHATTLEITREKHLTPRGDCIIGVKSSHGLADLREELLPLRGCSVQVHLSVEGIEDTITGFIHPDLGFRDETTIILRKSSYICPRTLLIDADKAARDINRQLIEKMKQPHQKMHMTLQSVNL
ncbi:MAG: DUF371 domain-containing protein [Theionarchaea archaeon]|nr:DUF371 domain-containing protein [Theionarchaea archaeon]